MKKLFIGIITFIFVISNTSALYQISSQNEGAVNSFIKKVEKIKFNESKINVLIIKLEKLLPRYKGTKSEILINDLISGLKNKIESSQVDNLYEVIKVTDGDTIKINYNGEEKDIRILGIDTPEKYITRTGYKECYGQEASDYATQELIGKKVSIEFDDTQDRVDKYGRLLAHVFYYDNSGNKIYYEENSIKNGYGLYYLYKVPTKYDNTLIKAQEEAKNANLGIWKMCGGKRIPLDQIVEQTQNKVDTILNTPTTPVTPIIDQATNQSFTCGTKTTCSQMISCEEAKFYLNSCRKTRLDGDKDGTPCESICK